MHRFVIVMLPGLIGLAGCELTFVCTDEARASVQLTLVDETDGAIADAAVSFRSMDLAGQPCEEFTNGLYVCGYEVSGTIEIDIEAAGYEPAHRNIVVENDACHVITEEITVTLTAATLTAIP